MLKFLDLIYLKRFCILFLYTAIQDNFRSRRDKDDSSSYSFKMEDGSIVWNQLVQTSSVSLPFAVLIVSLSISSSLSWTGCLLAIAVAAVTSCLSGLTILDLAQLTNYKQPSSHSFLRCWLDLLLHGSLVGIAARSLSHTVDLVVGPSLHESIVTTFGLTPYLNTFPDLLAGTSVVCTSIIIGVGLEQSKLLSSCLLALTSILMVLLFGLGLSESLTDHQLGEEKNITIVNTQVLKSEVPFSFAFPEVCSSAMSLILGKISISLGFDWSLHNHAGLFQHASIL